MNSETLITILLYIVGGFIVLLTIIWAFVGYQIYKLVRLARGGISLAQGEIRNVYKIFSFVKSKFTNTHDTDEYDNPQNHHRKI